MHYFCISFTHKNTDIKIREKLHFENDTLKKAFLQDLLDVCELKEVLLLSTCNRVELLACVQSLEDLKENVLNLMASSWQISQELLYQKADFFEDIGAIHHLFSVASSLDSLVVGETQIAGQLKEALHFSIAHHFCGINLSRAVHFALKCAAKIRNETEISKNPISVASVAVAKAKELIDLKDKEVVVIGAGAMSELACKHLASNKAKLIILNRTLAHGKELLQRLEIPAKIDDLSHLSKYLNTHEVFFCATGSNQALITDKMLEKREFTRYFFDIAVPRDIDLKESDTIKVFAVDDLEEVVKKNLALREHQAQAAYKIISEMTTAFLTQLNKLTLMPMIKALRLQAKECAEKQLDKALKKGYLKQSDQEEARKLIHQVFKAFLHTPTIRLKNLQNKLFNDEVISAMTYVFDIKEKVDLSEEFILKEEDEI